MKMKKIIIIVIAVILAVIATIGIFYLTGQPRKIGLTMASYLRLPIAKINGLTLSAHDYLTDYRAAFNSPQMQALSNDAKVEAIWAKIKEEFVLKSLARDYQIPIDDAQIDSLKKDLLKTEEGQEQKSSWDLYGYNDRDFTRRIILPIYYHQLLVKDYLLNAPNPSLALITKIQNRITTDAALFKQSTIDEENSDQLPTQMTEQYIDAEQLTGSYEHITALNVGDISGIIVNPDGYRLYKLLNKIQEDQKTVYQLEEIFVPSNGFSDYLLQKIADAEIKIYVRNFVSK